MDTEAKGGFSWVRIMNLKEFFIKYPKVAIAFSGGCDSSYLAYEAVKCARNVKAYYVKSAFQPEFEYRDAIEFAKDYSLDMKVIAVDILKNKEVTDNPSNRCYYCKRQIFGTILEEAKKDGFEIILDGTNASDDASDRPGMKSLQEMKVLSPLRICGLTKQNVRDYSKEAGLKTWDKPAYACLATRIPAGTVITEEMLANTEKAENYLFSLGFSNFRVRYRDGSALIQLAEGQQGLYEENKAKIETEIGRLYKSVLLDDLVRKG